MEFLFANTSTLSLSTGANENCVHSSVQFRQKQTKNNKKPQKINLLYNASKDQTH